MLKHLKWPLHSQASCYQQRLLAHAHPMISTPISAYSCPQKTTQIHIPNKFSVSIFFYSIPDHCILPCWWSFDSSIRTASPWPTSTTCNNTVGSGRRESCSLPNNSVVWLFCKINKMIVMIPLTWIYVNQDIWNNRTAGIPSNQECHVIEVAWAKSKM